MPQDAFDAHRRNKEQAKQVVQTGARQIKDDVAS
jgi:hypothetical protein